MLSGRVRADYSDWLRADQPSDTHHSSVCQNSSWYDAPEFEPEGWKKMKLLLIKNNQQKKEVKTNKDISDLLEDILIPRYSRWEWLEDTLLLLLVKRFHCSHFQAETDLTELLHLLVCVGVQLLRNVLHPEQSSSVLDPWLLHPVHRQPRVRNGSVTKRLHLLVQTAQRTSQRQPAGRTQWTKRRRRRILKPIAFD